MILKQIVTVCVKVVNIALQTTLLFSLVHCLMNILICRKIYVLTNCYTLLFSIIKIK